MSFLPRREEAGKRKLERGREVEKQEVTGPLLVSQSESDGATVATLEGEGVVHQSQVSRVSRLGPRCSDPFT